MSKYLILTPIGFCLTDFLSPKAVEWIKFSGSNQEIAEAYYQAIEQGKIDLLLNSGYESIDKIIIDQKVLYDFLKNTEWKNIISLEDEKNTFDLRTSILELYSEEEKNLIYQISKTYASFVVQRHSEARDVYIAQAIHAVDDITKTINLFGNRLSEWYGIHFPELVQTTADIPQLFRLIEQIGLRGNFTSVNLNDLSEKKQTRLIEQAENSLGVDLELEDYIPMKNLSSQGLELVRTRTSLEKYIEATARNIMPNVCALVGPLIASRLLAYAGSLLNLAKLPASTIQLLGAEKALFRHLKTGEKPPKHGIIFQSASIHTAPYHQRGKIARALAGKISIAARIDYFTGEDQSSNLERELQKRTEDIAKKYPKPPIRVKKETRPDKMDRKRKRDRNRKRFDKRTGKSRPPKRKKYFKEKRDK
ncbi:MAG: NOP5/NOP56 family protein [Candidatus Thorarchaeota archaeon]